MWIDVESSLTIIMEKSVAFMEKSVAFIFHYNYFLCVVHPQTLKPFSRELSFTYGIDIFKSSISR